VVDLETPVYLAHTMMRSIDWTCHALVPKIADDTMTHLNVDVRDRSMEPVLLLDCVNSIGLHSAHLNAGIGSTF